MSIRVGIGRQRDRGARRATATAWLAVLLSLALIGGTAGCTGGAMAIFGAEPTATATPTALPTATATATATRTPTATPTATPVPVSVTVSFAPEQPAQGQTMEVRVTLDRAATLYGDWDGQPVTFWYVSPTEAWAVMPVPVWNATGERALLVEAVAPEGQRSYARAQVAVIETPFEVQSIDVPADQAELLTAGLRPAEDRYLRAVLDTYTPEVMWEGRFELPSEGIRTSPFGARRSYQGGPATGYHGGIDLAAPEGTPIYAAARGVVVFAEAVFVRGNLVVVDHGVGVHTLYFHLSETAVEAGQAVEAGDLLGLMGTTGLSTGSHLHWEVRIGDIFVDPDEWLTQEFGPYRE